MLYNIRQFRFGDSDVIKIQLSAVSSANEFMQEIIPTDDRGL